MANPSVQKRLKEKKRQEKQREKEVERLHRKANKPAIDAEPGVDPDIAGIIPGPQPRLDEDEVGLEV